MEKLKDRLWIPYQVGKEFFDNMCKELKQTPEQYLRTISENNLSANKDTIRARANAINNNKLQQEK